MIDWGAFLIVFVSAIIATIIVVGLYSLGLRLLTRAGRVPVVGPAEFTDAITVITEAEAQHAAKRAAKATRKNPLTDAQKNVARFGAYLCFAACGAAVLYGIYLIVPYFHQ
jgi:hypothetical protein